VILLDERKNFPLNPEIEMILTATPESLQKGPGSLAAVT
jgi:hypothetical protein